MNEIHSVSASETEKNKIGKGEKMRGVAILNIQAGKTALRR